jgi:hypothetical protein
MERYLVERGGDFSQALQLMASMQGAAEGVTLDNLDRETKRGILRLIGAKVRMYPVASEYVKRTGERWEFTFSPQAEAEGTAGLAASEAGTVHLSKGMS